MLSLPLVKMSTVCLCFISLSVTAGPLWSLSSCWNKSKRDWTQLALCSFKMYYLRVCDRLESQSDGTIATHQYTATNTCKYPLGLCLPLLTNRLNLADQHWLAVFESWTSPQPPVSLDLQSLFYVSSIAHKYTVIRIKVALFAWYVWFFSISIRVLQSYQAVLE